MEQEQKHKLFSVSRELISTFIKFGLLVGSVVAGGNATREREECVERTCEGVIVLRVGTCV